MKGRERAGITAILRLRSDAYGVTIHEKAAELSRPLRMPPGLVNYALDRLEDTGLISSWLADTTPERGGRAKRFYRVEALAERAPLSLREFLENWRKERRPRWVPVRRK